MSITLPGVQDALIAITTVVGIAVLFAFSLLAAAALVRRDKARNRKATTTTTTTPTFAQQPTQTDRVPELASR